MPILLLLMALLYPALLQQTFTVIGSVRNQSGQAVTGVRVSLIEENASTLRTVFVDTSGHFRFAGLARGNYLVRIETSGTPFEEQTQRIELQTIRLRGRGDESFPIDFVLKLKRTKDNPAPRRLVFVQTVPEAARAEYERGVNSLKGNKSEMAYAALKRALEIFPDYFDALELLGTEYVKHNQFEAALPVLTQALAINRSAPKSCYALGVAYLKLSRPAEAVELLEKAAEQEPSNANVFMMLGLAAGQVGKPGPAEEAFKKAYKLAGAQVAEAHLYLAGIYDKQQRYREAWQELELFLKEAKDLKDPTQIRALIEKLKAKEQASR